MNKKLLVAVLFLNVVFFCLFRTPAANAEILTYQWTCPHCYHWQQSFGHKPLTEFKCYDCAKTFPVAAVKFKVESELSFSELYIKYRAEKFPDFPKNRCPIRDSIIPLHKNWFGR